MKVGDSALKHGIDPADPMQAAEHPVFLRDLGDAPHRQLRLGFDTHGHPGGDRADRRRRDQLVIHAMKARQQYLALLD